MSAVFRLLRAKWNPEPLPSEGFSGKTVIVTGSNVGLGLEAARHIVRLECAKLILAVRNIEKGEAARRDIEETTGRAGVVQVWQLDMDSFQSIKSFADRAASELERLDVALLNAGLTWKTFKLSPEDWEETLQVNVLATALLALLLLPKLRASRKPGFIPHLGIVGSGTHAMNSFPQQAGSHILRSLSVEDGYNSNTQYRISKLFVMYIVDAIASLVATQDGEPEVIVTSTCPGFCVSDLARQYDTWHERLALRIIYAVFARSTEEGSRTLVESVNQGVESHGKFWKDGRIAPPGPLVGTSEGERLRNQIWGEIGDVLKAKVPEVEQCF
ncbi:MAG: hypothetical protein M1839_000524 [Geoglossum umbratile]|nr:MAG: hypothetical protein M1839_000524 [Geoglossum umbratile]